MITAMADELRSQSMVVLGPMMPNLSQRFTESSSSRKKETRFDVIALASKSLLWHATCPTAPVSVAGEAPVPEHAEASFGTYLRAGNVLRFRALKALAS